MEIQKGLWQGPPRGCSRPLAPRPGAAGPVPPAPVALHAPHLAGVGRRDGVQPPRGQGLARHPPPTRGPPQSRGGARRPPRCPLSPSPVALSSPPWGGGAQNCPHPQVRGTHPPPSHGGEGGEEEMGTPRWEGGCHVCVCVVPHPAAGPAGQEPAGVCVCVPPAPPPSCFGWFFLSVFRSFTEKVININKNNNNISGKRRCAKPLSAPRWVGTHTHPPTPTEEECPPSPVSPMSKLGGSQYFTHTCHEHGGSQKLNTRVMSWGGGSVSVAVCHEWGGLSSCTHVSQVRRVSETLYTHVTSGGGVSAATYPRVFGGAGVSQQPLTRVSRVWRVSGALCQHVMSTGGSQQPRSRMS